MTPADSPLLRRPDLLGSMLTYWQRHPSLSYLFAGRFIGPTSQAPRVDEGRADALYELEIAFAEMRPTREAARRAAVDGRPRCCATCWPTSPATPIAPNSASTSSTAPTVRRGRLGLLELRGFEMPPHWQMALVQSLLVRSLVARFWDEPVAGPLIR